MSPHARASAVVATAVVAISSCTVIDPVLLPAERGGIVEPYCEARSGLGVDLVDFVGGRPGYWLSIDATIVGYALAEDSVIWTTSACAMIDGFPAHVVQRDVDDCHQAGGELVFDKVAQRFSCVAVSTPPLR